MNLRARVRPWADALLAVSLFCSTLLLPAAANAEETYGRAIFTYEFEVGKGVTPGGDGLGPVFNNRSCVACHSQGGVGGGGPIDVNVQMLAASRSEPAVSAASDSSDPPASSPQMCGNSNRQDFRNELRSLHPAFVSNRSEIIPHIVLHRFGRDEDYAEFRAKLGGLDVPAAPTAADRRELAKRMNAAPVATVKQDDRIQLQSVQRNTPALFGAGLIDQVSDAALHAQASAQEALGVVSGRVPPVERDRAGRFGWRGQTEHLKDFVLGACANELGLEVPGQPQPRDPLHPKARPNRPDLTQMHCESLTAFVASLPRPQFIPPDSAAERVRAAHGRDVFHAIGCAACHVRSLDGLDEIYGDLLLHDLGPELADPVAAEFAVVLVKREDLRPEELRRAKAAQSQSQSPSQPPANPYNGGQGLTTLAEDLNAPVNVVDVKSRTKSEFRREFSHVDREWRTPPLWGVADSAPYLHDGRAATLNEAISLHGGEALNSKQQYFTIPDEDRLAVVAFMQCLRAPR
jgi:CxxC motif-containing protein (DUF1111 family)